MFQEFCEEMKCMKKEVRLRTWCGDPESGARINNGVVTVAPFGMLHSRFWPGNPPSLWKKQKHFSGPACLVMNGHYARFDFGHCTITKAEKGLP